MFTCGPHLAAAVSLVALFAVRTRWSLTANGHKDKTYRLCVLKQTHQRQGIDIFAETMNHHDMQSRHVCVIIWRFCSFSPLLRALCSASKFCNIFLINSNLSQIEAGLHNIASLHPNFQEARYWLCIVSSVEGLHSHSMLQGGSCVPSIALHFAKC